MDLNAVLVWLANSGGSIVAVSWLLEQFSWWQGLEAQMKKLLFFGFSLLVSVAAYAVLTYVPAEVLKLIEPYFLIAYVTFTTVFLGEGFHKVNKI
jgi:hypothetical protein